MNKDSYTKVSSYEGRIGEVKRVVLLFSGGLDTSVMLKWIADTYKAEVIALTLDLGQQGDDLDAIKKRALKLGSVKAYVVDAKDEFADDYLSPLIKANGSYQGNYHISTVSRYLMAKWSVVVAYREKADAVAHGCTGKGNDQVRIDASVLALDPNMKIIAPVREWDMSRDEEIIYAQKNWIVTPARHDFPYSSDDNMWGVTWEGGEIEDPKFIPKIEKFQVASNLLAKTPNTPETVKLTFQKGVPIALGGKQMKLSEIIMRLNAMAGRHGVGVVHHLEDRLVGLKNRGVYELPGGHTIIESHRNLEKYVCTRLENELKEMMDTKWGYLCYGALWHDPVMGDINAFNDKISEKVTGEVSVRLFKGQATVVALTSPFGLHHASFNRGEGADYNIQDSAPFIEVYSMQARLAEQRAEKTAFISIGKIQHKKKLLPSVKKLHDLGYQLFATNKTHAFLMEHEIPNLLVHKISNGPQKPNLKDVLYERGFDLIINVPTGTHEKKEDTDGTLIRKRAIETKTPICTHVDVAEHLTDKRSR